MPAKAAGRGVWFLNREGEVGHFSETPTVRPVRALQGKKEMKHVWGKTQ